MIYILSIVLNFSYYIDFILISNLSIKGLISYDLELLPSDAGHSKNFCIAEIFQIKITELV